MSPSFLRLLLSLGILLGAVFPGPSRGETGAPRARALLVAVDRYPDDSDRLYGCIAGRKRFETLLQSTPWNLPATAIEHLDDQDATQERIERSFQEHLGGAGPDDLVIFFFSGHGAQLLDSSSPQLDGKAEVICTYDVRKRLEDLDGPTDRRVLTNNLLNRWLSKLKANRILVVLDCCHAASGTMGPPPTEPKPAWIAKNMNLAIGRPFRPLENSPFANDRRTVLFAACSEAGKAYVNRTTGQSFFADALCEELKQLPGNPTAGLPAPVAFAESVRARVLRQFREVGVPKLDHAEAVRFTWPPGMDLARLLGRSGVGADAAAVGGKP